jgi:integrase
VGGKSGLSLAFSKLIKKAGIKSRLLRPHRRTDTPTRRHKVSSLTFHSFRHTINSSLANEGVSEELRMKILGHSDRAVHAKYTHHEEQALREAMAKLPKLVYSKS